MNLRTFKSLPWQAPDPDAKLELRMFQCKVKGCREHEARKRRRINKVPTCSVHETAMKWIGSVSRTKDGKQFRWRERRMTAHDGLFGR
jgi:hypothetical protein